MALGAFKTATWGLSVRRPNDRSGFLSSAQRSRVATVLPCSRAACTSLTISSSLADCSRSGRGFLRLASSRSARLVTTSRSAKSISSRNAASWAAGSPPAKPLKTISRASPSRIKARRCGLSPCVPGKQAGGIQKLDRGRRHLLGIVERRQEVEPRVGEGGDPHLTGMDLARIGTGTGQELKQRALAASGKPDDSDTHRSLFLVAKRRLGGLLSRTNGWSGTNSVVGCRG